MTHCNFLSRAAHRAVILAAPPTVPATMLAAQSVVESEIPRGPDLTLANEPLVRVGMLDGPVRSLGPE